jgi:hypothetical protein
MVNAFNLDSAIGSTHLTQPIDSPGISGETLITNKVTAISPDTLDKPMDYAMHALPTAESRFNKQKVVGFFWFLKKGNRIQVHIC